MCKYCDNGKIEFDNCIVAGYNPPNYKRIVFENHKSLKYQPYTKGSNVEIGNELLEIDCGDGAVYLRFNYCPFCGRRLNCKKTSTYEELIAREG